MDSLAHYGHLGLRYLNLFVFNILTKQSRELIQKHLSNREFQLLSLPVNEWLLSLRICTAVLLDRFIGYFSVKLDVGVMYVSEHSYCVPLEVGDRSEQMRLVYFPESFIQVFAKAVFDHFVRIQLGQMIKYLISIAEAQVL